MKSFSQDEVEKSERMRYLESENEQLRDKLRSKDDEKREQYNREEKI